MTTPEIRALGSDPLDSERVTLSRQLRRILFEAGLVDSPDLPLYSEAEAARRAAGAAGRGGDGERGEGGRAA